MDHKEQHHEHHRQEREQHKKEHGQHEDQQTNGPSASLSYLPPWLIVLGTVLTVGAVLVWIFAVP